LFVLQDSEARIQFEVDLRAQLSRQAAAHSDHIVEVLKVQERELEAKFQLKLSEHIQREKEAFQQQVAGWVARLHGIEAALDSKGFFHYWQQNLTDDSFEYYETEQSGKISFLLIAYLHGWNDDFTMHE